MDFWMLRTFHRKATRDITKRHIWSTDDGIDKICPNSESVSSDAGLYEIEFSSNDAEIRFFTSSKNWIAFELARTWRRKRILLVYGGTNRLI